jgi:hypothetical protein
VATVERVATSPAVGVEVGPKSVYVAYHGGVALVDPELAEITVGSLSMAPISTT